MSGHCTTTEVRYSIIKEYVPSQAKTKWMVWVERVSYVMYPTGFDRYPDRHFIAQYSSESQADALVDALPKEKERLKELWEKMG